MTREQTQQVLLNLKKAYPFFYKDIGPDEGEEIADLWYEMFEDDDVALVVKAVKLFIKSDSKGFPPVIGVIKAKMEEIIEASRPKSISEFEAWQMVKDAARNSLYNSKKEFDKLPPIIQRVIGDYYTLRSWAEMDMDRLETIIQPGFIKSYKTVCEQENNYDKLARHVGINSEIQNKALKDHLNGENDKLYYLRTKNDSRPLRSHERGI